MKQETQRHMCACQCHGTITIHTTVTCDCGKVITLPPYCPPEHPTCPPPKTTPQPGTVEIPQPPPFKTRQCPTPLWKEGKPEPGSTDEGLWFQGKIAEIQRKGPCFGPRKDEFLPYLLVRTAPGDRGSRPFSGVFWESPDIFVLPNQEADTAPLMPPTSAGVAQADVPNTLYAHVWNLGKAPTYRVRVEFYWFNPSLGITRADAHLIGAVWIDLGNRFTLLPQWVEVDGPSGKYVSLGSHAIVRCPQTWTPLFVNQGHECLVVRASEPILDAVDRDQFAASTDRHVGQRNIAVVQAASPAAIDLTLGLGYAAAPTDAEVEVEMNTPASMDWLKLLTGKQDPGLQPPTGPVISGFLPPEAIGSRLPSITDLPPDCRGPILRPRERFHRGCDPLQIPFHASVEDLKANQAQVLRIRQRVDGDVIGGFSVVLLGKQS